MSHHQQQAGLAAGSYAVAIAVTMLAATLLLNLTVALYGRGVVRAALDEGVRAAARAGGDPQACQQQVAHVTGQLLGSAVQELSFACQADTQQVTAAATMTVAGWLGVPDWHFSLTAAATREPRP